jgi:hypothetical protein
MTSLWRESQSFIKSSEGMFVSMSFQHKANIFFYSSCCMDQMRYEFKLLFMDLIQAEK